MKEKHEKELEALKKAKDGEIDSMKDKIAKVEERADAMKDTLKSQLEREKEKTHEVSA